MSDKRILLVASDEDARLLIREYLRDISQWKADVTEVDTLAKALQVCKSIEFDAAILGIKLPDCKSMGSLIQLRSVAPFLPVVIISEAADRAVETALLNIGVSAFHSKNEVTPRLLCRSIERSIITTHVFQQIQDSLQAMTTVLV